MINFRAVTPADLKSICRHRHLMFEESGKSADVLAEAAQPFETWLNARLESGAYFGFIAEDEGAPVAGIGLMALDWPPHPLHPQDGRRGYILNLYVEKSHRGRGLAKSLMDKADAEFKARGIQYAILHPTEMAKPIYEKLGWQTSGEMVKLY
ncbi:MAG: GNAT family N-acetyltransferase [Sphingomonadales bacterium]|jgi:GNAT superfamily N-acetyltransferase